MAFDPNPYFRKLILVATHNPVVAKLVNAYGMKLGAARFVAGESFEANRIRSAPDPGHAIQMARGLAQQAGPQAVVLVIGSVYLAGQIKALLATGAGAGAGA